MVSIGLAGRLIETHTLRRDAEILEVNRNAARRLSQRLRQSGFPIEDVERDDFGFLLREVPVAPILEFLTEFRNHDGSLLTNGEPVRRYIEERQDDELAEWDVLFASVGEREVNRTDESLGRTIRCQRRTAGERSDARTLLVSNRQRVSTRGIERTGLSGEKREIAERKYREDPGRSGRSTDGRPIQYPDKAYRVKRTKPLLMIHLIDIVDTTGRGEPITQPVVAWGISFPPTNSEERRVEYVVNTTWLRENFGDDVDEDEMGGDDG